MPRLFVLGGGSRIPTPARQTSSYLLETRRSLVFFDCGSGMSRLHDPLFQMLIRRHTRAIVLLSGYGLDQLGGLHMLPFFLSGLEVTIAAPSQKLTGIDPAVLLENFGAAPFCVPPLASWGTEVFGSGFRIQSLREGKNIVLGERVMVQPRPGPRPCASFRVREVAYCSAVPATEASNEFLDKAAVIIHDAFLDSHGAHEHAAIAAERGVAGQVALLADKVAAGELVLANLNPEYDHARLDRLLLEACSLFPRTLLASDMMVIDVKGVKDEDEAATPEVSNEAAADPAVAGSDDAVLSENGEAHVSGDEDTASDPSVLSDETPRAEGDATT